MRKLLFLLALVPAMALAQPRTGGSGIKANCPSCNLVDATITSNGNLIAGATTANFITLSGAASGSASTIAVASSNHSAETLFTVDNDFNTNSRAWLFNTTLARVGSGTIFDVQINSSSVFNVDAFGTGTFTNNIITSENAQLRLNGASASTWIEGLSATHNLAMQSNVANASTNTAYVMDTVNSLSGTTSLLVLKNATVQKLAVDNAGNLLSASHLSCAMSAGTTCTATVPTGSVCMCQATAGSASTLSCAVVTTTATCTASAANSSTWSVFVW